MLAPIAEGAASAAALRPLRDAGFDVVTLAHSPTVAKLQYARTKEACGALGTRVRDLAPFRADRVVTHEQAHIDARLTTLVQHQTPDSQAFLALVASRTQP